jgi:rubredoxin
MKGGKDLRKFECTICGYIYDEAKGIPDAGIAPGTSWDDLPEDWTCPLCGASKAEFKEQNGSAAKTDAAPIPTLAVPADMKELSPLEMSALCTNLAKGCEKQYKLEEAALFIELASYYKKAATPAVDPDFDQLMILIEKDLSENLPNANAAASAEHDRGAKRALVWSEKVTRILGSILERYQNEGDAMLLNTGVYVCTICGFIYIGNELPDLCPVCKVPNWKFEKIEGR